MSAKNLEPVTKLDARRITVRELRAAMAPHEAARADVYGPPAIPVEDPLYQLVLEADWGLHDHGRIRVRSGRDGIGGRSFREILIDGVPVVGAVETEGYQRRYEGAPGWWVRLVSIEEQAARRAAREADRARAREHEAGRLALLDHVRDRGVVEFVDGQQGGRVRAFGAADDAWYAARGVCHSLGLDALPQGACSYTTELRLVGGEWMLAAEPAMDFDPLREIEAWPRPRREVQP